MLKFNPTGYRWTADLLLGIIHFKLICLSNCFLKGPVLCKTSGVMNAGVGSYSMVHTHQNQLYWTRMLTHTGHLFLLVGSPRRTVHAQ